MSTNTVPCVSCYWHDQRQADPGATIHENGDGSWSVQYSDGSRGPATYGTLSTNPRHCLCGVDGIGYD